MTNYYPDFFVKTSPKEIYIVETKGLEEIDLPRKMERLKQWCEDVNALQNKARFDFVFVDQGSFEKHRPRDFKGLVKSFRQYKK